MQRDVEKRVVPEGESFDFLDLTLVINIQRNRQVDLKFDLGFTANIIKRDQYLASESYIALSQSGQGCLQNWNPLPFQFGIRPAAAARNSGVPI